MTNFAPTASRDCCRGGRALDGQSGAAVRAYRWQSSAGEAYESIGVAGNHVVLAIEISCPTAGRANRHRDEKVVLTASVNAPTSTAGVALARADREGLKNDTNMRQKPDDIG